MKMLLQTVGTGGPDNPVWEALAYTIRNQGPFDLVVFLCSAKTAAETVPKVRAACVSPDSRGFIDRVVESPDPEHLPNLTEEYIRLIEQLLKDHPGANIHTDFTSGTKAMSAAIVAASVITSAAMVHYATGPRDQAGRAHTTDRVVTLSTGPLIAERELPEVGNMFNAGQYAAAEIWAKRIQNRLQDGELKDRACSIEKMARVCKEWDRFNFRQALHQLKEATKRDRHIELLTKAGWNIQWTEAAKRHLEQCESTGVAKPITQAWLTDLARNAARCHERHEYDNAVARCYRLFEAIGQHLLQERCGIMNSSAVPTQKLKEVAPAFAAHRSSGPDTATRDTVKLGLRDVFSVLDACGCPIGSQVAKDLRDNTGLGGLLTSRNNSLLAHGFSPVRSEVSKNLLNKADACLRELLADQYDAMQSAATFPRCPWSPDMNPWSEIAIGS